MWLTGARRSDCSKPVQACSVVKSATPVNLVHVLFWNNCSEETQCFNRIPPLSLRSRSLEVVGTRKNGRARGRHATPFPLACLPLVHPFFLAPSTSYYFQAPAALANRLSFQATLVCQRLFSRTFQFLSIGELRVIKRGLALSTITKNRFVTLHPPRDSDKLCILLQGFVWETYVSDMKIVHKIRSERF